MHAGKFKFNHSVQAISNDGYMIIVMSRIFRMKSVTRDATRSASHLSEREGGDRPHIA